MTDYKFQFLENYSSLIKGRVYSLVCMHNIATNFGSVDFDDNGVIVNIPYDVFKKVAIEVFE
jgi:hypothetical protein